MADRYDPKPSLRPLGDGKSTEKRAAETSGEDDPLMELARIVSGRSSFEEMPDRHDQAPEMAASSAAKKPLPSESDLARDLEAELLNELQASFSMLPEIASAQPQAASAAPSAEETEPAAYEAEHETAYREDEDAALHAAEDFLSPDTVDSPDDEVSEPAPYREPPLAASTVSSRRESLADRIARRVQRDDRPDARSPRPERAALSATRLPPARASAHPLDDNGAAGALDRTAPLQTSSRWDRPETDSLSPEIDVSRFAPRQEEDDSAFPDERLERGAERAPLHELDAFAADERESVPPLDDSYFEASADDPFDPVPGYDDDLPPYPDENLPPEPPQRSRRTPLALAAIFGVVLIGGAAAVMLRSGGADGAPPPIIAADSTPTKIEPENNSANGESEGQAKLIYDRVDPDTQAAESQLVRSGDQQIIDIPPIPRDTGNNSVSRVILEGGPTIDAPADNAATPAADAGTSAMSSVERDDEPSAIGPKRVRTVVVRPDGTIVSNTASEADGAAAEDAPAANDPAASIPPSSATPPAPGADENPLLAQDFRLDGAAADTSTPTPPVPPAPPAQQNPAVVAAADPNAAIPGGTPASGGDFLIQVSSQRSQDVALSTFRDLQRRYPNILGGRDADIQRADLGDRGVYYRVRVGYGSRDEAVRMCESLKAAGGDCILATR